MKSRKPSIPYIIWMVVFTMIPIIMIGFTAFTDKNGNFSLQAFTNAFYYTNIFVKSLWIALISTAICLVLAYPLAYLLTRMKESTQNALIMLLMIPMWMNFLLRTYAWMTLLGNNGIINHLLGLIGLGPYKLINTSGAVVLGMVYNYLPFMILPLYSVMEKIDKSVLEAASDLGCSSMNVVFVPAISTFIISRMLGGGSNLLIGDLIEMQFLGNSYNPNLGAAISLVLMVIILMIMTIMNQFSPDDQVLM